MALVTLQAPIYVGTGGTGAADAGQSTIDAANEYVAALGYARIPGGGSKTVSSAGGGIIFNSGAVGAFANASTNIRFGVQDVSAALPDGTFDVYADYVGGTDTITASTIQAIAFETGTKSITDGDLIAIVITMTARGGTDSVSLRKFNHGGEVTGFGRPWGASNPSGAATSQPLAALLYADDGTAIYLDGINPFFPLNSNGILATAVNSSSTPDEYAMLFSVPFAAQLSSVKLAISGVASTDDFEVILYSSPTGTPVAERTVSVDASEASPSSSGSVWYICRLSSGFTLAANTVYAVALRPTTTNNINFLCWDLQSSAIQAVIAQTMPLDNLDIGTRTDQTGAFSTGFGSGVYLPMLVLVLSQLDDGTGAGRSTYQMGVI